MPNKRITYIFNFIPWAMSVHFMEDPDNHNLLTLQERFPLFTDKVINDYFRVNRDDLDDMLAYMPEMASISGRDTVTQTVMCFPYQTLKEYDLHDYTLYSGFYHQGPNKPKRAK